MTDPFDNNGFDANNSIKQNVDDYHTYVQTSDTDETKRHFRKTKKDRQLSDRKFYIITILILIFMWLVYMNL
ncbi:hypothetical protein SDC9_109588 [bioreactor metagenome]|uniref:Uncharacterized protein n=1 Tax=bioreactor metagenome TaxID=1076179 RepID=A0A645BDI7_9ZZZZ|nr:hypothetical protein [Erysipelotrichaceae bacterium]